MLLMALLPSLSSAVSIIVRDSMSIAYHVLFSGGVLLVELAVTFHPICFCVSEGVGVVYESV